MQPRTWLLAALVVAMAGVAQPIIIIDPFLAGTFIAAGGAAALLGAAAVGAGAVGVGVAGAGAAVGAAKLGAVGAGAIGAAKVGAVGAGAIGTVGLAKVGLGTVVHSGFSSGVRSSYNNQHSNGGTTSYTKTVSTRRYRRHIGQINEAQEMMLNDAYALDQEKPCGLRLVCELATKGADELEADELLIMDLLQQPHSQSSMVVPYEEAANLGRISTSSTVCAEVYQRCEFDRFQIMQLLRQTYEA